MITSIKHGLIMGLIIQSVRAQRLTTGIQLRLYGESYGLLFVVQFI